MLQSHITLARAHAAKERQSYERIREKMGDNLQVTGELGSVIICLMLGVQHN